MQRKLYALSLAFHGALGAAVWHIESHDSHAATAIEIAETKKKLAAKAPEPPPPPPEPPKPRNRPASAPKAVEAPVPAAPLEALPDFGLELSGGVGGLAIAPEDLGRAPVAAKTTSAVKAPAPVVRRAAARVAAADDACDEPPAKPRPLNVPQPTYSDRAREAGIEGKVRVELTVDETGRVVSVRVLQGLGYGLDEAAVAAAERATFEPALRCGKPSRATFTMGIRFSAS